MVHSEAILTCDAPPLTRRQRDVLQLVEQYVEIAHEPPSSGWVARRLNISRKRAWQHMDALRRKKHWIGPKR